jgi:succinate dehydrogenase / fumarate reductase flavoprotein subunit
VHAQVDKLLSIGGKTSPAAIHRELGHLMEAKCGIARNKQDLESALKEIPLLRERFWNDLAVPGTGAQLNQSLEHAGRLADFLEFAELMVLDALTRDESCGCHFRTEHQTEEGEALRNDDDFAHVSVWEHKGSDQKPEMHTEPLEFEALPLAQRNYKT